MRTSLRSRTRTERGAAAVEFGLVAIVLLTLIVAIIQFAIWFWAYQVGAHAAREGARVGAVAPCDTGAITARVGDRVGGAAAGGTGVSVDRSANPVRVGDEVRVDVTFSTHEITTGFLPFSLPVISKSATARVENVPAGGC